MRAGGVIIGALYHPPRASYSTHLLLNYIESCTDELSQEFPVAPVVLAGDFNQIPDCDVGDRTGMQQLVRQPTRGPNLLDRIFVSSHTYNVVRVVTSLIKSDHKAVVAYASQPAFANKSRTLKVFPTTSPQQHAQFLAHISTLNLDDVGGYSTQTDTQQDFDTFYDVALQLLERFYPQRSITVTSRDPYYMTPAIKAKLRRKNRLMRAGRIEEADALALRIGKDIAHRNKTRLSHISPKTTVSNLWDAVRQLSGRKQNQVVVEGVTAESLNQHYASISTDPGYQPPKRKFTVARRAGELEEVITEFRMFENLDKLQNTATGLDLLPAWFLRLGAPVFCGPLARLFNKSVAMHLHHSQAVEDGNHYASS